MALISRWTLDGTPNDMMGVNNGSEGGTVNYSKTDRISGNKSYIGGQGNTSYIALPYTNIYSYTNFSITAWFRTESFYSTIIMTQYKTGANNPKFLIYHDIDVNRVYYAITNDSGTPLMTMWTPGYGDDKWHFLVITDANGSVNMYIDNVGKSSGSYSRPTVSSDNWTIGAIRRLKPFYGGGKIDDVRFYNSILSLNDVKALYASYFTEKAANFMSTLV